MLMRSTRLSVLPSQRSGYSSAKFWSRTVRLTELEFPSSVFSSVCSDQWFLISGFLSVGFRATQQSLELLLQMLQAEHAERMLTTVHDGVR